MTATFLRIIFSPSNIFIITDFRKIQIMFYGYCESENIQYVTVILVDSGAGTLIWGF